MRGRLKEARKQEREHDKNENKEEHADSGTHLAASSSSSFLYSPRWLQKIMVSDSRPVTHINHTQTHMIKRREEPCKDPHTDYWGKTPSFFLSLSNPHHPLLHLLLLFLSSLLFSLSAHPSGSGCRDDVLPAATTARSLFGRRAED